MGWKGVFDVLAVIAIVIAVPGLLLGSYRIGVLIPRWQMAARIYGLANSSVGLDVYRFSKFGSLSALRRAALICMFVTVLPLLGEGFYASTEYRYVWDNGEWRWIAWFALWLSFAVGRSVIECELAIPPAVLLLGPSCPELERELSALNRELRGYRTLALLRPNEAGLSRIAQWSAYVNNMRTHDLYQWRSIVFQLMDVVPLIVICHDDAPNVVEEARRIARCGYQHRTYETARVRLAEESEHQRLKTWLTERLATIGDQSVRSDRQELFDWMRAVMPIRLQYPRAIDEFVEKASILLKFGRWRFVMFCKKIDPSQVTDWLLEDIPSPLSRAEELQILREDRVFEEVEILLDSVEEIAEVTDANPAMNRATLTVKRGQLARYRGEWEAAEKLLRQAIEALNDLRWISAFQRQSQSELGTACFYLGDVALARHRESRDSELFLDAKKQYRASATYTEMAGGDRSSADRRITTLSGVALPLAATVSRPAHVVQQYTFKSKRQMVFRVLRGFVVGGTLGGLASMCAVPFVPEGHSTVNLTILMVIGLAGLGVFKEIEQLNRDG